MVGAVVITANNGKEALDILQQQRVDAVLMDIQMPIMDGLEAARRARDLPVPGIRSLPILAMTAHAMDSDREKSFRAGMQEHLTKPVDPRQMYAALAKWITAGKASPTESAQPGAALPGGLGDMPGLSKGQTFDSVTITVKEGSTTPPKHYTEDTLLSSMETAGAEDMPDDAERKGLGTPATRAAIIEKLVKSGFVERSKKNLLPTDKGKNLIAVLPDALISAKLTAE